MRQNKNLDKLAYPKVMVGNYNIRISVKNYSNIFFMKSPLKYPK